MNEVYERRFLGILVVLSSVLATIAITPKTSADPINPIKMVVIVVAGFVGMAIVLANFRKLELTKYKLELALCGIIFFWLSLGIATSGKNFYREFFGAYGRNGGALTYISLLFLMVIALLVSNQWLQKRYIMSLGITGFVSLIYGYMQYFGFDPAGWVSPYSPVLGFLGNPDFAFAFLGISLIAIFSTLFSNNLKLRHILFVILIIIATLFLMLISNIQQGLIVFFLGIVPILLIRLKYTKYKPLIPFILSVIILMAMLFLFSLINKGPLASFFYERSLAARGYYWEAAINMVQRNPIFGLGMDSYGDWYRRSRSLQAFNWSPTQYSDSSHNVYLDLAVGGGLPLLVLFISLNLVILVKIYRNLKTLSSFDPNYVGLIGCWVGFHAQLFISIHQSGIAIWGWVITGIILGYRPSLDVVNNSNKVKNRLKKVTKINGNGLAPKSIVAAFIGLIVGLSAGLPIYVCETIYFKEMSSGDPVRIQKAAYLWPPVERHYIQVGVTLRDNKQNTLAANPSINPDTVQNYNELGIQVAREAVKKFPNSIYTYQLLRSFPGITNAEDSLTKKKIRELDPFAYSE